MKKIQYIVAGLALLFSTDVFAQTEGALTLKLNYSLGIPAGSFRDAVSNTSYRGFGAELMYHTSNQFSVGLETGSQDFYQKFPRQLYKGADGSDISAVLSNSIQTTPILIKAQYNFLAQKAVQPYVALAAGGNIIGYKQYAGEFGNGSKTKFSFAARPEAGFYIPLKKYSRAGFSAGAGYNFMPFNYNGISNLNNITIRAGISFPLGQ
ncbi:MAG: outer membrane beta-barrel protein [Bacteroidota bacterium]